MTRTLTWLLASLLLAGMANAQALAPDPNKRVVSQVFCDSAGTCGNKTLDPATPVEGLACGRVQVVIQLDRTAAADTTFAGEIQSGTSASAGTWSTELAISAGTFLLSEGRQLFRVDPSAAPAAGSEAVVTFRCQEEFSGGGAGGIPGLDSGGIGNDETLQYIYDLPSFRALPNLAGPFYFSSDAGGDLPLGDDANNCTQAAPCRTIAKASEIAYQVYAPGPHLIFDAGDTWDWSDIADVGGPSTTESIVLDATADTITRVAGNWNLVNIVEGISGGRIVLTGTAGDDGTYTVSDITTTVITVVEDITVSETVTATVQQFRDQIHFTHGCGSSTAGGLDQATDGSICGAVSSTGFDTGAQATFDCSGMGTDHFINGYYTSDGLITHRLTAALHNSGAVAVQNLHFVSCGNDNDGGFQDILRTDNGKMIMHNIQCDDLHGFQNQCWTGHGITGGDSITTQMGGSVFDGATNFWQPSNGGDHALISNKRIDHKNDSGSDTRHLLALSISDDVNSDSPYNVTIIGPHLTYSGAGGSTSTEAGIIIPMATPSGKDPQTSVHVGYVNFTQIDNHDCSGSAATCSAPIQITNNAADGRESILDLYLFKNTFYSNKTSILTAGNFALDTLRIHSGCNLIEFTDRDANGDSFIVTLIGLNSASAFDWRAINPGTSNQDVWDCDDHDTGDQCLNVQIDASITEYNTVDLCTECSGLTSFFQDPTLYESRAVGQDGNQFCPNVGDITCAGAEASLESIQTCARNIDNTGATLIPECSLACTQSHLFPMGPELHKMWIPVIGAELKGLRLGGSPTSPVNAGRN
jgi:hypothetical protein